MTLVFDQVRAAPSGNLVFEEIFPVAGTDAVPYTPWPQRAPVLAQ